MSSPPARQIGSLTAAESSARLRGAGLGLTIGPFQIRLQAQAGAFEETFLRMYRDHPLLEPDGVFSCHLGVHARRSLRPPWIRLVRLSVDGRAPHEDMPAGHAFAVFEWGLNLVVALRKQRFLMLHAAVVERHGRALVLPAAPGSGKTTLCAALANRGWRQLSDEFGLIVPGSTEFLPMPRPMPLKNESIDVMRAFAPDIELGPVIHGTRKGTIAHVRPSGASVARQHEPATIRWLVFPQWQAGAELSLQEVPREEAFMRLASNAFNYEMQGAAGFQTVRSLIDISRCFTLVYSHLDRAVSTLTGMADMDRD